MHTNNYSDEIKEILNSPENDYIDFKREWYKPEAQADMIHDILCMSNSLTDKPCRYIVIGVSESERTKQKEFHDTKEDKNAKTAEEIIDKLRNFISIPPKIEILNTTQDGKFIELIKITPVAKDLPYVLSRQYQNEKKNKTLLKNVVYSRNSSQNTPVCEQCDLSTLEKLFAKRRGEYSPIKERYSSSLEDIYHWEKSDCSYYHTINHRNKFIKKCIDNNVISFGKINCYLEILSDTYITKEYWDEKKSNYDDYYSLLTLELYADNTLIQNVNVFEFYTKYFFTDMGININKFYIPVLDSISKITCKEDILNTSEWKLCKIMYYCDLSIDCKHEKDSIDTILNYLNYEFLKDKSGYIMKNKDWIYNK